MIELIIRIELSDCSEAISFLLYQVNEEIRQVVFRDLISYCYRN